MYQQDYNGYSIYVCNENGISYWIVTDEVVMQMKVRTTISLSTLCTMIDLYNTKGE